jgi:hypothetical protein
MTSKEVEKALLEFFRTSEIPEEFNVDKKHLLALADMQNEDIEVPEDLEANILARLAREQNPVRKLNKRVLYTITSIAAGLALIVSTFMYLNRQPDLGTYDDPQVAYAETREALELVSKYFNHGTEKLSGLNQMEKAIQPLNTLGKVNDVSNNLKYLGKFEEGIKEASVLINK